MFKIVFGLVREERATSIPVDQYHGVFTDQFIFRAILKHRFLENSSFVLQMIVIEV